MSDVILFREFLNLDLLSLPFCTSLSERLAGVFGAFDFLSERLEFDPRLFGRARLGRSFTRLLGFPLCDRFVEVIDPLANELQLRPSLIDRVSPLL